MSATNKSILLGGAFAIIGSFFGPLGAQIGWFIGSTAGSILGLEDESEITHGPRITDFKVLNSKYGITIPRGFGCVRFNANLIWTGPIIEEVEEVTECVKVGGRVFFIDVSREICQTTITYHYFQSAAFALCEGPIAGVTKVWADGKLVYSQLPTDNEVTVLETLGDFNPSLYTVGTPLTFYLGTATQENDPIIEAALGEDTVPYRNIAYIMMNEVKIDDFGYRLPTLNAEVCFGAINAGQTESSVALTNSFTGSFASVGMVQTNPNLQLGVLVLDDTGETARVIYNLATGEPVFEATGGFDGGVPSFIAASSSYNVIRGEATASGYRAGVYNFQSGEQVYWHNWTTSPGSINYTTYNPARAEFYVTFSSGAMAVFPDKEFSLPDGLQGFESVAELTDDARVPTYYPPVAGAGREVFSDAEGNIWWLSDGGAGSVYVNRVSQVGGLRSWQVQFSDGSAVDAATNWTYAPSLGDFFILADVPSTSSPSRVIQLLGGGGTLSGSSHRFYFTDSDPIIDPSDPNNNTRYDIRLGGPGGADLSTAVRAPATSIVANGLPVDGQSYTITLTYPDNFNGDQFTPVSAVFQAADPPVASGDSTLINFGNTERAIGSVTDAQLSQWFPNLISSTNEQYLGIITVDGNKVLRIRYVPNWQGSPRIVVSWRIPKHRTYRIRQSMYFEPGFQWGRDKKDGRDFQSAKVGFGLGGGTRPSGGSTSKEGFTMRLNFYGQHTGGIFDGTARFAVYAYRSDRQFTRGQIDQFGPLLPIGQWIDDIIVEVEMNSATNLSDGSITVWMYGAQVFQDTGIQWWSEGPQPLIDTITLSTFYGGNGFYAPADTNYIRYRNIEIAPVINGQCAIQPGVSSTGTPYSSPTTEPITTAPVESTPPTGLYRLNLSAFDDSLGEVLLPAETSPSDYLNAGLLEQTAFQAGPSGYSLYATDTEGNIEQINLGTLSFTQTIGTTASLINQTFYAPNLQTFINGGQTLISFRAQGVSTTLGSVVSDLMTLDDGDPKSSLTVDDIDVTDIELDTVRGFSLLSQQAVRNAITQLQQTYFFDVVESDGKLKFIKRGKPVSLDIVEDDLAAHESGNSGTIVPIEIERVSTVELPREVVVNYTDIELDYNQGTQRARRDHTDSESNISKTLPVVLTSNEAAKVADILLATAWNERVAPVKFRLSAKYIYLEPCDVISVTMRDGTVHVLRIVDISLGANTILELTCHQEFATLYLSAAEGQGPLLPPQVISSEQVQTFVIDVPSAFVNTFSGTSGSTGVLVGVSPLGDPEQFDGATVSVTGGSNVSVDQPLSYGTLLQPVGDTFDATPVANQFDNDNQIVFRLAGGDVPAGCTAEQAQTLSRQCLVIVGDEIIAFTDVSFVDGVVTLSGLLRGLYGTENSTYHGVGEQVVLAENLSFAPVSPSSVGGPVTGSSSGSSTTIGFTGASAKSLSPVDPTLSGTQGGDLVIAWERRDTDSSALGIQDINGGEIVNSTGSALRFEVLVLDPLDPAGPSVKRQLVVDNVSQVTYTQAQQTADWGAPISSPILIQLYQLSPSVGRGFLQQTTLSLNGVDNPSGVDFFAPVSAVSRWNGAQTISGNQWLVSTTVDTQYGAAYLETIGATQDIELFALVEAPVSGLSGLHTGLVLRGLGDNVVSGMLAGLGDGGLMLSQRVAGEEIQAVSVPFTWSTGVIYALRARYIGNRVQVKAWPYGEWEPSAWPIDVLDGGRGPFFGFSGVFAYHSSAPTTVEYLAWAHNGLIAA